MLKYLFNTNMKNLFFLLFSILFFPSISQNLNIEGTPVVLPRMTSIEMDQISPVPGMVVYNTDRHQFQGFVADNIFLDSEKFSVCQVGEAEINLSNYSIKIDFDLIPLPDSILIAVELVTTISYVQGSLALYDSDPCYSNTPIAVTSEGTYDGHTRFTFITPVRLHPNQSYWLVTQSGTIVVLNDCVFGVAINTYSYIPPPSPGEYCSVQNAAPRLRLIGVGEWVDLH